MKAPHIMTNLVCVAELEEAVGTNNAESNCVKSSCSENVPKTAGVTEVCDKLDKISPIGITQVLDVDAVPEIIKDC